MWEQDSVRRFFSRHAVTWDALYGGRRDLVSRFIDRMFRRDVYERYALTFERLGANLRGRAVLDVGCGSGVYAVEAARRGAARVVGVDLSAEMIALAQTRCREAGYADVCRFVCAAFPLEEPQAELEAVFDHGIAMGVMDYVSDPYAFLKAMRRCVAGSAILSFPGRHWLREPLRRYRYKLLRRCPVFTYEEGSIRAACLHAGFSRLHIHCLDHSGICYIVTAHA